MIFKRTTKPDSNIVTPLAYVQPRSNYSSIQIQIFLREDCVSEQSDSSRAFSIKRHPMNNSWVSPSRHGSTERAPHEQRIPTSFAGQMDCIDRDLFILRVSPLLHINKYIATIVRAAERGCEGEALIIIGWFIGRVLLTNSWLVSVRCLVFSRIMWTSNSCVFCNGFFFWEYSCYGALWFNLRGWCCVSVTLWALAKSIRKLLSKVCVII